jgi:HlyD family secretion protein
MQVDTNVAEADVGRLQVGMGTYFTVDAFPGQRFRGKIREIRNAAIMLQNVVTYDAVIDVDNTDLRLRPGMTANVTVIYDEKRDALGLPNAVLRFHPPPSLAAKSSAGPVGSGSARSPKARPASSAAPAGDSLEPHTIWALRGGAPQPVAIHIGLSDGTVTEVLDGDVHEGDELVLEVIDPATKDSSGSSSSLRRLF